jgi:hypothetical protein
MQWGQLGVSISTFPINVIGEEVEQATKVPYLTLYTPGQDK